MSVVSAHAGAQVLKVESDLIIKPSAEWSEVVGRIDVTAEPTMANMTFAAPPYGAKWTNVIASVMDGLKISSEQLPGGVIRVKMNWDHPGILIYNMEMDMGTCFAVNWRLPSGGWQAEGHMTYDYDAKQLIWLDFAFLNNASGSATVNLGECTFGPTPMEALTNHLLSQAQNPIWMAGLVQESLLKWAKVTFASAKVRLLDPITVQFGPYTTMTWEPSAVTELANGMWRVPGVFSFDTSDDIPKYNYGTVRRTEAESVLNSLSASQVVLPVHAMEQIAAALARNRGFFSRTLSTAMPSFTALLGSRRAQGFEWEDLLKFPLNSKFAFDVGVYGPVTLGDRKASAGGGLNYSAKTSMAVHAQADVWDSWFPYFDFRSVETGRTLLSVDDGGLSIHLHFDRLHLRSYLRDEFTQVRTGVEDFTNMELLNPRFYKFFQAKYFSVELPRWRFGNQWELVGSDLTMQPRSLRIPLTARPDR